MKLSDEIRTSIGLVPQTWNRMFEWDAEGEVCKACVFGTVLLGRGFDPFAIQYLEGRLLDLTDSLTYHRRQLDAIKTVEADYPWLRKTLPCPKCGEIDTVSTVIYWHLGGLANEGACQINREEVADWLDTVDPTYEVSDEESSCEPERIERDLSGAERTSKTTTSAI